MTEFTKRAAERADGAAIIGGVLLVVGLTTAFSYQHEVTLARHNGQVPWVADLLPFSLDGLLMIASIALYWAARNGIRRAWQPMVVAAVGVAATISANFFSDVHGKWLGPAVSGSSGVAAVLVGWVAWWMLTTRHELAEGTFTQRDVNCSCPPPAMSLAEAIPAARQALKDAGLPHGQEALADRFCVTTHQIRKVLAPPVEKALMNGAGHVEEVMS